MRPILLLLGLILAGAATAADPLIGTRWKLVDIPGRNLAQVPKQKHPTLRFDGVRAKGRGVCNVLTATYTLLEPDRMSFGRVGGDMLPCREGQQLEEFYIEQIQDVQHYAIDGDALELTTRTGKRLRFARQADKDD